VSDIAQLFAKDPATLTDEELDAIIDHLRSARHLFKQADAAKQAKPKRKAKADAPPLDDLLSDLDL